MKTIPINYFDFFTQLGARVLDDGIYEVSLDNKIIYISEVKKKCLNGITKFFDCDRLVDICFYKDNLTEGESLFLEYKNIVTFRPHKRIN